MSHRTVYRHFPTREALLEGLSDAVESRMMASGGVTELGTLDDLRVAALVNFALFSRDRRAMEAAVRFGVGAAIEIGDRVRRTKMFQALVADEIPDLAPEDAAMAGAMLRQVASSRMWLGLVAEARLDDESAARTSAWAVDAVGDGGAEIGLASEVRVALERALAALGGVVAVRSSAVVEDLPDASWAGQYESVLGVRTPAELFKAIDVCVAGASSSRVRAYAADTRPMKIAILMQQQIHAEPAGVAVTANPVTGDDEVLVSAVLGLGDRMAAGEVTPEDRVRQPGHRAQRVGGPEHVLAADDAGRIADEAIAVADLMGAPVDIEWALVNDDLHLLQARPITVLPVQLAFDLPTDGPWEMDTSHYSDLMSPVGASLYLPALDAAVGEMAHTYGLLIDGAQNLVLSGEVYTRIIPPDGKDGQRINFLLFMPYCMALHELCVMLAKLVGWDEPAALELVGGLSGTSSAPARDLHALADLARQNPAVEAIAAGWSGQSWDDTLAAVRAAGGSDLARRLEAHLDDYGCRTTGYDPGQPSIAEGPDLVVARVSPDRLDARDPRGVASPRRHPVLD